MMPSDGKESAPGKGRSKSPTPSVTKGTNNIKPVSDELAEDIPDVPLGTPFVLAQIVTCS